MRIDPTDEQVVLPPPPPENERERLISSRLTVNHTGKLRAARPLARFLPSPLSLSLFSQLESNVPSNSDAEGAAFVCPSIPALALLASSAPVGKIIMKRRDNHSHSLFLPPAASHERTHIQMMGCLDTPTDHMVYLKLQQCITASRPR